MNWNLLIPVFLLSLGPLSWAHEGMVIPEYDGKDRVHHLNIKNYKSVMREYDVMVVYYHEHVGASRVSQKQFEIEELALEVSGSC